MLNEGTSAPNPKVLIVKASSILYYSNKLLVYWIAELSYPSLSKNTLVT